MCCVGCAGAAQVKIFHFYTTSILQQLKVPFAGRVSHHALSEELPADKGTPSLACCSVIRFSRCLSRLFQNIIGIMLVTLQRSCYI
jgi:hypothetical protein